MEWIGIEEVLNIRSNRSNSLETPRWHWDKFCVFEQRNTTYAADSVWSRWLSRRANPKIMHAIHSRSAAESLLSCCCWRRMTSLHDGLGEALFWPEGNGWRVLGWVSIFNTVLWDDKWNEMGTGLGLRLRRTVGDHRWGFRLVSPCGVRSINTEALEDGALLCDTECRDVESITKAERRERVNLARPWRDLLRRLGWRRGGRVGLDRPARSFL